MRVIPCDILPRTRVIQKRAKIKTGKPFMTAKKPVDQIENLKPNLEKKDLQRCHIHISFDTNQGRKFFRDLRATKCTLHRLCAYRSWPRRRYSISTLSLSIFISNKFSIHTPCTPPWVWGLLSIIGALSHYH